MKNVLAMILFLGVAVAARAQAWKGITDDVPALRTAADAGRPRGPGGDGTAFDALTVIDVLSTVWD